MNRILVILFLALLVIIFSYLILLKDKKDIITYSCDSFNEELKLFEDNVLKSFIRFYLTKVPKEFWEMPASTSGKYHPSYALGKGGLIRHTKAAVKIANSLLTLEMYKNLKPEIIISALLLHDSVKPGFDSNGKALSTQSEHPIFASDLLGKTLKEYKSNITNEEFLYLEKQVKDIQRLILSHMGQWNKDRQGNEILPKPEKEDEKFVHLCDYLASRRFLEMNMEEFK